MNHYYLLGTALTALILREVRRIRRENEEVIYTTRHPPAVVEGQQKVLMAMAMQLATREDPDLRAAFAHQVRLVRCLGFSEEPGASSDAPTGSDLALYGPRADGSQPLGEWLDISPTEAKRVR